MSDESPAPFRLALLATGGTLEKSYDAHVGTLTLDQPVIEALLAGLEHPDIEIAVTRVMAIDSLDMGEAERVQIVATARRCLVRESPDAVVVTHGTDTLAETAAALATGLAGLDRPVVLTGAMRPFRVAGSDAAQNVAQAVMAARLLGPGVYAVFHGRVLPAGRIVKDYQRLTFVAELA
jgi:L-asparaginase